MLLFAIFKIKISCFSDGAFKEKNPPRFIKSIDVSIPRRKPFSKSQKCSKDGKAFHARTGSQGTEWGGRAGVLSALTSL